MQYHSSAMLEFYGWLLGVQEDIHERARAGRWLDAAGETADTTRSVRLNGGQDAARDDAFVDLLRHLAQAELATDVVRTAAGSMVDVGRERREMLLRSVLDRRGVADPSSQLPHDLEPHTFLGRAFLQPLAEAMATREADNDGTPRRQRRVRSVAGHHKWRPCVTSATSRGGARWSAPCAPPRGSSHE